MFYVLGCFGPRDRDRAGIADVVNTQLAWESGRRFAQPPPTPVQVELDRRQGAMVPMFDAGILLFSDAMLAAVTAAGVDNLDVYDAIVRDPVTGAIHTDYKAINVIGVVAAADLARSKYRAPSGSPIVDTEFDSLVIDEKKIRGPLVFRLAECITAVIVHESVKRELLRAGIPYLDFYAPEDFIS
jgi:hypothetical protein